MNFQDALKSSFKSKDDIAKEKELQERQEDLSYVEICVNNIERELLQKASEGDYELDDSDKLVKCLYLLENDSLYLDRIQKISTIQVQFNERYSCFIDNLRNRLSEDNIYITKEYLAQQNFKNPLSQWDVLNCPAIYAYTADKNLVYHSAHNEFLNDIHAKNVRLVLECKTIVPDEYSEEFIEIQRSQNLWDEDEGEDEDDSIEIISNDLADVDNMDGQQFESFCVALLSKNGFTDVEQTQGSGDQGIDIIAFKDDVKFGIQCKCYGSDVGNRAVQEVFAGKSYYHCNVAAILTNSHFTQFAKELAQINNVILWDRKKLSDLIENTKDGDSEQRKQDV